ncbi:SURF1-like protein [Kordiimonas sediminis]|uniref:SURF1-like protein n=1 Tax=Kordiimonas sediminis TaxID=1735581 RepID=A0A919EAG7_9PROT|nr:SURF1 family cytochrome oxidase biogenesis protein [Kordiimonas sediminis]GHF30132.1 SURF1-like protein [Kordiimonas sediminis]
MTDNQQAHQLARFAPGTGLTVTVSICLIILLSLGTWQAMKVGPKTAFLKTIETGLSAEPTSLPSRDENPAIYDYRRVTFEGSLISADSAPVFGTNLDGDGGYHHYAAIQDATGQIVLVNFGWAATDKVELPVAVGAEKTFSGVLRQGAKPGMMTLENNVATKSLYVANIDDIAAVLGLGAEEYYNFRVMLDPMPGTAGSLVGGQVVVEIPNNHLQYAFTWYGIAGSLIAVYLIMGFSRARKTQK